MGDETRATRLAPAPRGWLLFVFALAVCAGAFFRFEGLGRKVVWFDEAVTMSFVSGYAGEEVGRALRAGGEFGVEDLLRFQRIKPGSGVADVVSEVGRGDPQLSPLYFAASRLWWQLSGDTPEGIRALTALLSLLALPCMFWLCLELFDSRPTAFVAAALLAVSPFHVVYAQEARPYSLLATAVVVSSAALLYALRAAKARAWALYAATAAAGLYSHALFAPVLAAHGVYVAARELKPPGPWRFRLTRALVGYALAGAAALAAFAPWALKIYEAARTVRARTAWLEEDLELGRRLRWWAQGFARLFVDLGGGTPPATYGVQSPLAELALWPFVALVLYALYFVCRRTPPRSWLLVLLLAACVFVPFAFADFAWGGRRSTVSRYLIPAYVCATAAVAHLLASGITKAATAARRRVWGAALVVTVSCGFVSCVVISREETWRNKGQQPDLRRVARAVNESERPLVVTTFAGMNVGNALALSHRLDARARFRFIGQPDDAPPAAPVEVFYLGLTDAARRMVEAEGVKLEPVQPPELWRVVR